MTRPQALSPVLARQTPSSGNGDGNGCARRTVPLLDATGAPVRNVTSSQRLLPTVFLSSKQLFDMTGYRRKKSQEQWLLENGYTFDIRSDGRPNVLLDQVRERQCKKPESTPGPDLSWL